MFNRKIRAMLIAFGMTVCTVANAEIYSATAAFTGLENGFSYGHAMNASTLQAAKQSALDQCNRKIKTGDGVCKIKQAFAGPGCIALAVRGDNGEYALAKSKTNSGEAQSKALAACNEKSNKHDCRIVVSDCTINVADSGKKDDSGLAGLEDAYGNDGNDAQSGDDLAGLEDAYGDDDGPSEEVQKWTQGLDGFEKAFHTDLLKRGNAAYERGDYDTAIKLFQESVDHGHPTAHQLIGYAKQAKAEEIARQKAIAEQQRRERERQQQIAAEKERQRQLAEQQEERERRARELAERERERERESEKSSGYASGASIALGMLGALAEGYTGNIPGARVGSGIGSTRTGPSACDKAQKKGADAINRMPRQNSASGELCAGLESYLIAQWMFTQCAKDSTLSASRRSEASRAARDAKQGAQNAYQGVKNISTNRKACRLGRINWTGLTGAYPYSY